MRLKYLRISIGSLAEVGYGLHLAHRLGHIPSARKEEIEVLIKRTAAPLHGLVAHLKRERTSRMNP